MGFQLLWQHSLFITCKIKYFQVYWSVDFVNLFVCQLPTGHNSNPIVMKLDQIVEVVLTEKPVDFEVKGHLEVIPHLKS